MFKPRTFLTIFLLLLTLLTASAKQFTIVIDAGHGGHDYGAIGSKTNEKSINLAVAKAFGAKIEREMKDVKVVYTRSTDVFISLNDRATIANRAKGDLFVSIHVNSIDKNAKNRTTINGAEVYTLGLHRSESNLAVAKRENSVMTLEANNAETYKGFDPNSVESYIIFELSQSKHLEQSINFASLVSNELHTTAGRASKGVKQAGFWVLWATAMPAVLVELEFICNPNSEAFLASTDGQAKYADALFNAFKAYRESNGTATAKPAGKPASKTTPPAQPEQKDTTEVKADKPQEKPEANNSATAPGSIEFRVQIMANDRKIPLNSSKFSGVDNVEEYFEKGLYKYTVGHYGSFNEAKAMLQSVKSKYPSAFIIKMKDGIRIYD
jgi:N-acetylmuramoyl-L-alanine amidase